MMNSADFNSLVQRAMSAGNVVKMKVLFMLLAGLVTTSAAADSFRCGPWIVSQDLPPSEIREKCGEPDEKTSETTDVMGKSGARGGVVKRGTTTTEKWIYDRGTQARPMLVIIVDGKTRSVQRVD